MPNIEVEFHHDNIVKQYFLSPQLKIIQTRSWSVILLNLETNSYKKILSLGVFEVFETDNKRG